MQIKAQLLTEHSKKNTDRIRKYIGTNERKLAQLMNCFFANEYQVSQRAAMVVSAVFDNSPELIVPFTHQLIDHLLTETFHIAIKRNIIRILQFVEIPEEKVSVVFDHCLQNIVSKNEPIAVKGFSMKVLNNICDHFPELKHEVIPVIQLELERNESAGVLNRGKKVLEALKTL